MKDSYEVLLHGLVNSFLPESIDVDKLEMNDALSEPTLKALTQFLDHHLGDVDVGTKRLFTYGDVQKYFGNESVLVNNKDGTYSVNEGELKKNTPDANLRTILGSFTVTRSDTGYDILDAYDFSQRPRSTYAKEKDDEGKLKFPEWKDDNSAMSLMDIAYRWTKQEKWMDYETVRAFAGNRIPEKTIKDSGRVGLDPKESSTLSVNWSVPEGPEVSKSKFKNNVLSILEKEK